MDHDSDFAAYAREAWGSLVRSAVFLGCNPVDAEDLAQTTLVRCYTAWPSVVRADNRTAYVYRVLVNCLRDSQRRRWRLERPTERMPDRPHVFETQRDETVAVEIADAVHRALAGLTKPNRDVVVLRYFAGLSEQQTAAALEIPPGTVKSRLSRALAHLAADDHLSDLRPYPTGGS